MIKHTIAATLLLLTVSGCAETQHRIDRAVYVQHRYAYDDSQMPILTGNDSSDPGRHWHNEFRGRNWQ